MHIRVTSATQRRYSNNKAPTRNAAATMNRSPDAAPFSSPVPPIPPSASAPAVVTHKRKGVPLSLALSTDSEWLTPNLCLLREQIEVFAATSQDIAERKTGVKPFLGSVGLRCRHCAHVTSGRTRGAVIFPTSISLMHQAVRNFHRYHFFSCQHIPDDVKERMRSYKPKENQSKRNSAQYWIQSSQDMLGMIDVDGEDDTSISKGSESCKKKKKKKKVQPHIRFRDGWVYNDAECSASSTDTHGPDRPGDVARAQAVPAPGASEASGHDIGAPSAKCPAANVTDGRQRYLPDKSEIPISGEAEPAQATGETGASDRMIGTTSAKRSAVNGTDGIQRTTSGESEISLAALGGIDDVKFDVYVSAPQPESSGEAEPAQESGEKEASGQEFEISPAKRSAADGIDGRRRTMSPESEISLADFDGIHDIDMNGHMDALFESGLLEATPATKVKSPGSNQVVGNASGDGDSGDSVGGPKDRRSSLNSCMLSLGSASGDDFHYSMGENSANRLLDILGADAGNEPDTLHKRSSQTTESSQMTAVTADASSLGTGTSTAFGTATSSSPSRVRMQLLDKLETFLGLVQTNATSETGLNLVGIGKSMYRAFTGVEPPPNFLLRTQGDESDWALDEALEALADAGLVKDTSDSDTAAKKRQRPMHMEKSCTDSVPNPGRCLPIDRALQDSNLPVQLTILIMNLLTADDDRCAERYQSTEELQRDLLAMLADPDRHLFDVPLGCQTGRLEFSRDRLYGCAFEQNQLAAPFDRVFKNGGPREACFVTGVSGIGKTTLVEMQLRSSLYPAGGRLISGKFDVRRQRQPMTVICQALDDFCKLLAAATDGPSRDLCARIADVIDAEGLDVLCGLMPHLRKIISPPSSYQGRMQSNVMNGVNQLFYYLALFIGAIATPMTPIVIFLDDLQWADNGALNFVARVMSERSLTSLLFIGCYREDEIDESHPIMKHRQDLAQADVFTSDVSLGNMEKKDCHEMISDLLHLPSRITRSLSDVLHSKTTGNPLFLKQFLQCLYDEKLLWYSASARRWEWDIEGIQGKDVADDVAAFLTLKMVGMDSRAQDLLKLAACLGSQCKASVLAKIDISNSTAGLMERDVLIQILVNEGVLSKVGDSYRFSHDQVQQAAYQLIPPLDRAGIHLKIGRELWRKALSAEELDEMIFIVVDQYIRGVDLLTLHSEVIDVAKLCLMAGKAASAKSAFVPASIYFLQGTALLRDTDWEHHYHLSLELFTCCVKAQYVTGNYDAAAITYNTIMLHGRNIHDKLPAYLDMLYMLGAQGKYEDAISSCLGVLEQLGEPIKRDIDQNDLSYEFFKTRSLLQSSAWDFSPNNALSEAPVMHNRDKEAAIMLMSRLARSAYQENQFLLGILVLRSVQIILSYGVCKDCVEWFASYGLFLCKHGQIQEGYCFGKLALCLLDRFNTTEALPQVYCLVYTYIFFYIDPLQSILPELRRGYEIALRSGNIERAITIGRRISPILFTCGPNLLSAAEEVKGYLYQMKVYSHSVADATRSILQMMLILMGDGGEDPAQLNGEVMNHGTALEEAISKGSVITIIDINTIRLKLMYLFGSYKEAGALVKEVIDLQKQLPMRSNEIIFDEIIYKGLVATAVGRTCIDSQESDQWKNIAEDATTELERLSGYSTWNFAHKAALLNAEVAYYLRHDEETAVKYYKEAIELASEHKFIFDHALALERAATFHSARNRRNLSRLYFRQSECIYRDWGAARKADAIKSYIAQV